MNAPDIPARFFMGERMPARKIEFAPELIAEAKRLYETTTTQVGDIAAMLGVCRSTLTHRANEWGWRKRAHAGTTVELVRMVRGAVAAELTGPQSANDNEDAAPVSPQQRAALAQRIQIVVERQMAVVEQIVGILGPSDKAESERTVRMLAGVSRTLREIAALNQPDNETPPNGSDDDIPCDIDELRHALARRIRQLVEERIADAGSEERNYSLGAGGAGAGQAQDP